MLRKLIQFFKQPFPCPQKKWQQVVITVFGVSVVLTIVQYMGVNPKNFRSFAWLVGGYTVMSAIGASFVSYFLPIPFRRFFGEKRWTRGKYFVFSFLNILTICIANTLYDYCLLSKIYFVAQDATSFSAYLYRYFKLTLLIGIIPATLGYFWLKDKRLYSDSQKKEDPNQKLIIYVSEENVSDKKPITLFGNTKDSLTLFPHELLFMESKGNYIRIQYKRNGQILQKTLRATLLQMENLLSDYPFLVRCHRAFIVNVSQIEKIKGLTLWLKSTETKIPISKTYRTNIPNNYRELAFLSHI